MKKLPRNFYNRPTLKVAIDLLGCHIISRTDGVKTGGMIVETEAYIGQTDPACHASNGLTERNKVMHGSPGILYVYFTYGNHFMMNVVTEKDGYPAAVLLRGLEPLYGVKEMAVRRGVSDPGNIASGPGKLAKALGAARAQNGTNLSGSEIYIRGPFDGRRIIMASPRIGIGEPGSERLWRFFLKDNLHVSRPARSVRERTKSLSWARKISFSLPE
ncbi:MAG: DNA-3-methyladenine glycosylase [candidate division Zixibacteria bacterium]